MPVDDAPYLACALCGFKVWMAQHYTDAVMRHDSNGYHRVSFTAELVWKPTKDVS